MSEDSADDSLKHSALSEVMAGKVPILLYKSRIMPDLRAIKLLMTLKDRSDDAIMLAIMREDGRDQTPQRLILFSMLVNGGVLTKKAPEQEWDDIRFAWRLQRR